MFDDIRDNLPDRFINVGSSEQTMLDMAVGFAMSNKIPVCFLSLHFCFIGVLKQSAII